MMNTKTFTKNAQHLMLGISLLQYRERDLNPHSHHWPKDFKSFVSTDSTITAQNRCKSTAFFAHTQEFYEKTHIFC